MKRIAILYSELASYTVACLDVLKSLHGVDLLLYSYPQAQGAPLVFKELEKFCKVRSRVEQGSDDIIRVLRDFSPDGIVVSGWMDKGYLRAARYFKRSGVPVIGGLDGQWHGTFRQRLGTIVSPWYLHSAFDFLWVTGERQAHFARKLGFHENKILYGFYCCDWNAFARHAHNIPERNGGFLFIGRYVKEKGIDVLIDAYVRYKAKTANPWPLYCIGKGPLSRHFALCPGIVDLGFVQPSKLPNSMSRARSFILPSLYEPWGVVVQEAAASGLPVICSNACGAGVHLVQDGLNGFVFETGNAEHLAECMVRMTSISEEERLNMGATSFELSKQFRPERWANTLIQGIAPGHSRARFLVDRGRPSIK